jgi:hypothetical protein
MNAQWKMNGKWWVAAAAVAAISVGTDALASPVYEATTLVTQPKIDMQTLNLQSAGTVSVKLTDLKWPDLLGTLSFTLFDATHVIGSYSLDSLNKGLGSFNVDTAGTYYASIFASPASGQLGGLYNAQIFFQATSPVPLPAAAWLLISGLAGLAAMRPKQKLSHNYA